MEKRKQETFLEKHKKENERIRAKQKLEHAESLIKAAKKFNENKMI